MCGGVLGGGGGGADAMTFLEYGDKINPHFNTYSSLSSSSHHI